MSTCQNGKQKRPKIILTLKLLQGHVLFKLEITKILYCLPVKILYFLFQVNDNIKIDGKSTDGSLLSNVLQEIKTTMS